MTSLIPLPVDIVNRPDQLSSSARELAGADIIALDTESNSFHHYPEQLCLIQIASRHKVYIIDTISLHDLAPLRDVLSDVSIDKVLHAADYDIRSLDRHSGLHIRNVFDTSIAARFTGVTRLGLGVLTRDLLGIILNKSKYLQRADWGRRPLSAEALEYAATDVRHLMALKDILDRQLRTLGRETWVAEECGRIEEVRYTAPNLEMAYLDIKGSKDLDGRELAVLQSLVRFREAEARIQHRPPFFVLPDPALIYLAVNPQRNLVEVPGLGQIGAKRFREGLQQALRNGITAPPVQRPPRVEFVRSTEAESKRLTHLKAWRTSLGSSLSLDPSLLWPLASLERLAKAPDTLSVELTSGSIRSWQRNVVASSLQDCLSQF